MRVQVETYAGGRLHERPRRFSWGGRWLRVTRVLRRWREPERLCFQVAAADGGLYLLKYHYPEDAWEGRILRPSS